MSNFGPSIGSRGVMAPGVNITSASPNAGYNQRSGTSFAAPFVTGAIALLWSIFPTVTAAQIKHAIISSVAVRNHRTSIIPPLLNAQAAQRSLKDVIK
jgi:subtilisin family serine protease